MGKLGRLLAVTTLAVTGFLGLGSPAFAESPTVEFTDACGAVNVRIIGAAGQQITYSRNGDVFATFIEALADGSGLAGVHANGDVLTVTVGATPFVHNYTKPAGCTLPAEVTFEVRSACQGLTILEINNSGSTAATDYRLRLDSGTPQLIDPIQPGLTIIQVNATKVQVTGPLGLSSVLWLLVSVTYTEPDGCDPDTVSAVFVDTCDGVKVTVTSTVRVAQGFVIVKNPDAPDGDIVDAGFVVSGTPSVHTVPAAVGDEIAVYYPTMEEIPDLPEVLAANKKPFGPSANEYPGFALIGAHIHARPSTCGGTGGGLPVTGFQIGLAAGVGLLLIAGGAVLFVISRRRRFAA